MTDITGKYEMIGSENFDAYMESIGVGYLKRKIAGALSSAVVDITKDGPTYTLKTSTTVKNTEVKFELGKPFEETTLDDRKVQSTFALDGNVLKQTQTAKDFESTIDREFTGSELIATLRHGNVTATRKYKKV